MSDNNDDEYEFWLFTGTSQLSDLETLAPLMQKIAPCVRLKSTGSLLNTPDGLIKAELCDEEGSADVDVCWEIQMDKTQQAFRRDRKALQSLEGYPIMLRFLIDEDYALEPAFAMMHALLTLHPGMLVIPDEEGQITLTRSDALALLEDEIKENQTFSEE
ncbi:MAG: hypothetical protein RR808_09585 [Akkermansia sp.]